MEFSIFLLLVICVSSSNAKTKSLFTPWKIGSTKWFKFGFWGNNSGFGTYLFQLIVNCGNNFALSWVDKVTTGTCRFVSVISNVGTWSEHQCKL